MSINLRMNSSHHLTFPRLVFLSLCILYYHKADSSELTKYYTHTADKINITELIYDNTIIRSITACSKDNVNGNWVLFLGRCFCEPGWDGPLCQDPIVKHGECDCRPEVKY